MSQVKCGKCKKQHFSVQAVKACHEGRLDACSWLVEGYNEDGLIAVDCGAEVIHSERGWYCAKGHSYVYMEVRRDEGWDYAADEIEAGRMEMYAGLVGVIA